MRSIQEYIGDFKGLLDRVTEEWGIPAIVILVGLASFGLGRLSTIEETKSSVSIGQAQSASAAQGSPLGGLVVASRSGSAYHFPWCAGASTIKEGNKVWFKDEAAAKRAGYAPAKNCKGLRSD